MQTGTSVTRMVSEKIETFKTFYSQTAGRPGSNGYIFIILSDRIFHVDEKHNLQIFFPSLLCYAVIMDESKTCKIQREFTFNTSKYRAGSL